jgi:hypothetical protein
MKQFQLLWPRIKIGLIVLAYVGLVVLFALRGVSAGLGSVHFSAATYLGKNTRIGNELLVVPVTRTLEDNFRLARERRRVVGKYLREPVEMGKEITSDKLAGWPDLDDKDTVAVGLDSEPDSMVMNEGTIVEVRADDKIVSKDAMVLAIVPWEKKKWLALLPKSDITYEAFATSKRPPTLTIEALPEPVQHPAGSKLSFVVHTTPTKPCSSW